MKKLYKGAVAGLIALFVTQALPTTPVFADLSTYCGQKCVPATITKNGKNIYEWGKGGLPVQIYVQREGTTEWKRGFYDGITLSFIVSLEDGTYTMSDYYDPNRFEVGYFNNVTFQVKNGIPWGWTATPGSPVFEDEAVTTPDTTTPDNATNEPSHPSPPITSQAEKHRPQVIAASIPEADTSTVEEPTKENADEKMPPAKEASDESIETTVEAPDTHIYPGLSATLTAHLTSPTAKKVLVVLEVYDVELNKVHSAFVDHIELPAERTKEIPFTWNVPKNLAPGKYLVSLGVFGEGWDGQLVWHAGAANLTVEENAEAPSFDAEVAVTAERVKRGETVTVESQVTASEDTKAVIITSLIQPDGTKEKVAETPETFQASTPKNITVPVTIKKDATKGSYQAELSVKSEDQTKTYLVEKSGSFTVEDSASSSEYSSRSIFSSTSAQLGKVYPFTVEVTSPESGPRTVQARIIGPDGEKKEEFLFANQSMTAGEPLRLPVTWNVPTTAALGNYSVSIGIFSTGWDTMYDWNSAGGAFKVVTSTDTPSEPVKDTFEANDTPAQATPFTSNELQASLHVNQDVDYYSIELVKKSDTTITLSNIPAERDYHMEILKEDLSTVATLTTAGNANEAFHQILEAGKYYVKIWSAIGSSDTAYYTLTKAVTETPDGPTDPLQDAKPLYTRVPVIGQIESTEQKHLYKIDIATGGNLVLITETQAVNPEQQPTVPGPLYKISVLDSQGNPISVNHMQGDDLHSMTFAAVSTGRYYVKLEPTTHIDPRFQFQLTADGSAISTNPPAEPGPEKDQYEDNNDFATAKEVFSGDKYYGSIHNATDVDYFFYETNPIFSAESHIKLSEIPAGTDYNMELYDENFKLLGSSKQVGNTDEYLNLKLLPGKYYIKVYSVSGFTKEKNYKLDPGFATLSNRLNVVAVNDQVYGSVEDNNGSSLENGIISIRKDGTSEDLYAFLYQGAFNFNKLTPGTYHVTSYIYQDSGTVIGLDQAFNVPERGSVEVKVELPGDNVSGTVTMAGTPLASGTLQVSSDDTSAVYPISISGGSFSAHLPAGSYTVTYVYDGATGEGTPVSESFTVHSGDDTEVTIDIP